MTATPANPSAPTGDTGSGQAQVVRQVLPVQREVDVREILTHLRGMANVLPFDESVTGFVSDLSRRLGRAGRGLPEVQALSYWMRRAEIARMASAFADLGSERVQLMPRGLVFHVPPANVDTLFVYSWVLSILVGNRNVVRLSSRATDQSNLILDVVRETMVDHPSIASSTAMVTYGHDDAVTGAISEACDVRVIWGGDASVSRIRAVPIPPHTTELVFADRFSMAALRSDAYRSLAGSERDDLAAAFFNDSYWFDQLGCSSPRLLVWVGADGTDDGTRDFFARVQAAARARGYTIDTSAAIAKISQSYRTMIDAEVTGYSAPDNSLTVLDVDAFPDVRGEFCGGGLFYQWRVQSLDELVPHVRRADQTLAAFGFGAEQLRDLVVQLRGRGIDRIVPFGQALQFSRFWDGYDLLSEFTRKIVVDVRD